uniref:Uncharacterized protein n=1 Tax=Caenorhabditis japonica TaxID=281687 RepID=A0A8R1I0G6_CAEJA
MLENKAMQKQKRKQIFTRLDLPESTFSSKLVEGMEAMKEQLNAANGVTHMLRTCYTRGKSYKFDDGATMSNTNQCVTRTTRQGKYYVALCTTGDYCNMDCRTETVQPTLPPPPNVPLGVMTCYDCLTTDGTDCTTNTCQGAYCLYGKSVDVVLRYCKKINNNNNPERRLVNNQMTLRKTCLSEPAVELDDETVVQSMDVCEVRNTASSRYYVKICSDVDFCNNYCNPGQAPPVPQKQPLVRCYDCETSNNDCFTGSCEGNFCIFEKQVRIGTTRTYVRKSCSALAYAQYPDGSYSGDENRCETRVINDIEYNVKVCNSGNMCNAQCTGDSTAERSKSQLDPSKTFVKKSCANTSILSFPNNTAYTDIGHCQYSNLGSVQTALKACNSPFCNTACSDVPLPTPSPQINSFGRGNFAIFWIFAIFIVACSA